MSDNRTSMLGVRFTPKEMEDLGEYAKNAGCKNLSKWARGVLLAELTGENRDAEPDVDHITCACGHTRTASRIQAGFASLPGYDPGCPKCGVGKLEGGDATCPKSATNANLTRSTSSILSDAAKDRESSDSSVAPSRTSGGATSLRDPVTGIGLDYVKEFEPIPETKAEFGEMLADLRPRFTMGGAATDIGREITEQLAEDLKVPRSWSSEWDAIDQMEQTEALARFNELRAGRPLPAGFKGMSRAERIAWLDKGWTL